MAGAGTIRMQVAADDPTEQYHPMWNWFGYDEPNYTYTEDGKKLLRDLAAASDSAPRIRTHNLLTSGDGEAALKWGSTNAYSEGADGEPIYDWTIMDRIFDAYVEAGTIPFVQVAFTPEALSSHLGPYRHNWSLEDAYSSITTGWAAPPNDLDKWGALVRAWARHLVERYGRETVAAWPWECWNEPDGHYWLGTVPQFCEMFAVTVHSIKEVLPEARVGGPHTCGAYENPKAEAFLREVLAYVTEHDIPIDFVAFHAKGQPKLKDGGVRMGLAKQLQDIRTNLEIIAEFPSLAKLPVIIGESDPEGCAACSARVHPQNAYRNGPLYGSYVVESMLRTYELSRQSGIHIEGAVTWAFMFDGQPWFDGFRDLSTNGVPKAVLNAFRLLGMLKGDWVRTESDGQLPLEQILREGIRRAPDVGCVATRDPDGVSILVWNYHDDERVEDSHTAQVEIDVSGLGGDAFRVREFRMDSDHGNAFKVWQDMGRPQQVSQAQIEELQHASTLPCLDDSRQDVEGGALRLDCALPRHGVSLFRLEA